MAFGFTTGTAANMAAFFAALEAFLLARGWNLVAGGGTTDITYTSTGEALGFTKLYIRIWRDATQTHRINFCVQDDAAGTHNTQDATYGYMSALNVQFEYWICGDLDCIFITVKGISYSGAWLGAMVPVVIDDANEEYYMLSMNPENTYSAPPLQYCRAKILRNAAGAWNQTAFIDTIVYASIAPNPLDGGISVPAAKAYLTDKEVYGMPKFFAGPLREFPGGNPEDIYDSGEAGSAREWLIFGSGETRWAMLRVGPSPANTRGLTADYFTSRGNAANWNQIFNVIIAAAQAAGWTVDLHPSGGWRFLSSGELGTETIYCWSTLSVNTIVTYVQDDAAGTHYAGDGYNYPAYFPCDVFAGADKDCILYTLDKGTGPPVIHWMGRALTGYLDEAAVGDEYKLCAGHTNSFKCLRRPDGTWAQTIGYTATNPGMRYRHYSPQNNDGSYIAHWPLCSWGSSYEVLYGLKHLCYVYPSGVSMYNYDLLQMDNGDLVFYRTNNLGHRAA